MAVQTVASTTDFPFDFWFFQATYKAGRVARVAIFSLHLDSRSEK